MLQDLIEKKEELNLIFSSIGDLNLYEIKQWSNRKSSITLNFRYLSKRGKGYLFTVSFSLTNKFTQVFQNLSLNENKTSIELRVAFSNVVDLFLEFVLLNYFPALYLQTVQLPVKYPPSYLSKEERIVKKNRKKV